MKTLTIDSCNRRHLTAVLTASDGQLLESMVLNGSLAISIPQAVHHLLDEDVVNVVVVTGPGSYTGIRAGLAAALGLASARDLRLFAITRLAATAQTCDAAQVACVLDAGRGGGYTQRFTRDASGVLAPSGEPEHVTLAEWSPPADHTLVSDSPMGDRPATDPVTIAHAASRAAMGTEPLQPFQIAALYVSKPTLGTRTPPVS